MHWDNFIPTKFDADFCVDRSASGTSEAQFDASNASAGAKMPFAAGKWPLHIAACIDSF
jgi:hypothetical protein